MLILISSLFVGCTTQPQYTAEDCMKKNMYPEVFKDGSILCRKSEKVANESTLKNLNEKDSNKHNIMAYRDSLFAILRPFSLKFYTIDNKFVGVLFLDYGDQQKMFLPEGEYIYSQGNLAPSKKIKIEKNKKYCFQVNIMLPEVKPLENCIKS